MIDYDDGLPFEVRISVYRKGRRIEISDARGETVGQALYHATGELEREHFEDVHL